AAAAEVRVDASRCGRVHQLLVIRVNRFELAEQFGLLSQPELLVVTLGDEERSDRDDGGGDRLTSTRSGRQCHLLLSLVVGKDRRPVLKGVVLIAKVGGIPEQLEE